MTSRLTGLLICCLVASGCGSARQRPISTEPRGRVHVVRVDPSPPLVQIVGASAAERRAARQALARLGAAPPITRVVFDNRGPKAQREIVLSLRSLPGSLPRSVLDSESEWLGQLVVLDVVTALERQGITIAWSQLRGVANGGTLPSPTVRLRRSASDLRTLGQRIVERGEKAGLDVRDVTAFPISTGAVRVVVRLTEQQIFANANANWLTTLVPDRARANHPYSVLLLVLGPNGIPVAFGANWVRIGGVWSYGASSSVHGHASPPLPDRPTRLAITIFRPLARPSRLAFRLDCEGRSERVLEPRAACAVLEHEWLAFLPPIATDTTCLGGLVDQMSVKGTIGGVRVSRDYSNCYALTTRRWEKLLGVRR